MINSKILHALPDHTAILQDDTLYHSEGFPKTDEEGKVTVLSLPKVNLIEELSPTALYTNWEPASRLSKYFTYA